MKTIQIKLTNSQYFKLMKEANKFNTTPKQHGTGEGCNRFAIDIELLERITGNAGMQLVNGSSTTRTDVYRLLYSNPLGWLSIAFLGGFFMHGGMGCPICSHSGSASP